jgi:hypothetical protein
VTTFFLYILLLPINVVRLHQMVKLVRKARVSAQGDLSMDWLKPFMISRKYHKGDVLFRKGDRANEMFMTITGKFLVREIGVDAERRPARSHHREEHGKAGSRRGQGRAWRVCFGRAAAGARPGSRAAISATIDRGLLAASQRFSAISEKTRETIRLVRVLPPVE